MPLTKITTTEIDTSSINQVTAGPTIANVSIANSTYVILDDTAVSNAGGYIIVTGTKFQSGAQVLIGNTVATSVTFVNSTTLNVQVPALTAGTYTMYIQNPDGSTGIRINALTSSPIPVWATGSTLTNQVANVPISISLSAASDSNVTFSLANGSSLPSGTTLASNGLFSGTVSISTETTYNFSVNAIDAENQEALRSFSVTVQAGEPYFNLTTLLLSGDGTNNANNNVFQDSSTNNFTITRNGNTTQGSFSPFSQTGWSNYFSGSTDNLKFASNAAFGVGTGNFTVEFFLNSTSWSGQQRFLLVGVAGTDGISISRPNSNDLAVDIANSRIITYGWTPTVGRWYHVALVRSGTGSNQVTLYIDGSSVATGTSAGSVGQNAAFIGGLDWASSYNAQGYISNLRFSNTARTISVPTSNYTSDANTVILSCQSNRFIDNSSNGFAITVNGTPSVQAFSPFYPTAAYTPQTIGGSGYFDGTGDYLNVASNTALTFGTGDFTVEGWFYANSIPTQPTILNNGSDAAGLVITTFSNKIYAYFVGAGNVFGSGGATIVTNTWYHFAWVRSGSTHTFYLNGAVYGATYSSAGNHSSTGGVGIGYSVAGTVFNAWNGYIANVRMVKGTAVYTGAFTPPIAPVTTSGPASSYSSTTNVNTTFTSTNTSILLNFTNAGIVDSTAKNVLETVGNAQISTTQSKFGGSSIYFDGNGDALATRNSRFYDFSSGDFTVEFWFRTNTLTPAPPGAGAAGYAFIVGQTNWNGINSGNGWCVFQKDQTLHFYAPASTLVVITTGNVITSTSTWYHIAIVRSGTGANSIKIYVDGTQQAQGNMTFSYSTSPLMIGGISSVYGWDQEYITNGYIDDLRITRFARYTANFTAPTSPHTLR